VLKYIVRGLLVLAFLAGAAFFTIVPGIVDRQRNRVTTPRELQAIDSTSQALHGRLTVVDLHADPLLWPRELLKRVSHGHVDVPRLIAGNVAVQVFAAVTKVPPGQNYERNPSDRDQLGLLVAASRWPVESWANLLQRALHQARKLEQAANDSRGRFTIIRTRQELETLLLFRARDDKSLTGGILALEGMHPLQGSLARLDTLFQAGYRIGGLTHFFDNEIGGSSAGMVQGGLTPFGREVVARMESLGMVIDLAHASPELIDDVLKLARQPVLVSHTGVQGTCPGPRNLSDTALRQIAANGGVIGIGFWDAAICDISPEGIARAIRYVATKVGVRHVAVGSDFDGATTTAFDVSGMAQVTMALRTAGFPESDIRAIMGENALRVLRSVLP
jgi:microsomal dipeptidase-like Zn-dependent dipeptidase